MRKDSLFVRAFLDEDDCGCFFHSDFLELSVLESSLAIANLGVKTPEGKLFREIPLGYVQRGGWLKLFFIAGEGSIRFYANGKMICDFPLEQEIVAPFDDDLAIGASRDLKPDTYGTSIGQDCFKNCMLDTIKLWHRVLSEDEIQSIGAAKITRMPKDTASEMFENYNLLFDASLRKDVARCAELYNRNSQLASCDPSRPAFYLTQPVGHIYDPCGAFYYDGKYHVFSYHNIAHLLKFSSLDHYVSDDLLHWTAYPMGPLADSAHDVFSIYLMNHFLDSDGNVKILYTGQGYEGKHGIMAESHDSLVSYTNKRPVITKYHHDGHVFKRGNTWYTLTSRLTRGQRSNSLGDPVMLWSSLDLERWTEEGVFFETDGFMEFPYLLSFGDKDVLMLGTKPQVYYVGKADFDKKQFIPDSAVGNRVDNTNRFHCFNPMCVDQKGMNGANRRIIMSLYCYIKSNVPVPRYGAHLLPRELSLCGDHLMQEPIAELKTLRKNYQNLENIHPQNDVNSEAIGTGNCFETIVRFQSATSGRCGIKISDGNIAAVVYYDHGQGVFGVSGDVLEPGEGRSYLEENTDISLHVFFDKSILEVFVNGQVCSTATKLPLSEKTEIHLFGEKGTIVDQAEFWNLG